MCIRDRNIKFNDVRSSQLGGYLYLERDKLKEDIKRKNDEQFRDDRNFISVENLDKLNLYFLDQIVAYCNKNGIVLCFIIPPQHKLASEDMSLCNQLHDKCYADIPFYNFRYMELPDSCFGDLGHLNYRGAKVFSEYLEKEVIHKNNYPAS